jgi:FOG: CheY-like receiver
MAKILLVEDHPALRYVFQRQLEWMGFSAISATNGNEGVVAEKPDFIMMNSIMPEMNGWEATQVLGQIRIRRIFRFWGRRQCDELRRKITALIPASVS